MPVVESTVLTNLEIELPFKGCNHKEVSSHLTLAALHDQSDSHVATRTDERVPECVELACMLHAVLSCCIKNELFAEQGYQRLSSPSTWTPHQLGLLAVSPAGLIPQKLWLPAHKTWRTIRCFSVRNAELHEEMLGSAQYDKYEESART